MSSGLIIALVFASIYQIVKFSVDTHINEEINIEVTKHLAEIEIDSNQAYLIQVDQWRAREHTSVDVNPVFVQFLDYNHEFIDKSPNLKELDLQLHPKSFDNKMVDTFLNHKPIRQIQVTLKHQNKEVGYLLVAMSLDDSEMVLRNLSIILFISFPIILLILFLTARFFAGQSIKPIKTINETATKITKDNLNNRIPLPKTTDELYMVSKNINDLLDRIQQAIQREKQFTSDASHELRTPLAVVKGTLEVLNRKPREVVEYQEKINFCIAEVNHINTLVDELLLLARYENQKQHLKLENVYLNGLLVDVLARFSNQIIHNSITVNHSYSIDYYIKTDYNLFSIIISNILSNALKYTPKKGTILVEINQQKTEIILKIYDNGIGISESELNNIFQPFYRSEASNQQNIKGTGLGLSIVQRLCEMLQIEVKIESKLNKGTVVVLRFLSKY